jgi:hypothetical protein
MSRDLAISQTAAAMLAWFQQQLSHSSSSSSKLGGPATVRAVASAAHVPIASVGLNAATMAAAAAAAPAATVPDESAGDESSNESSGFGRGIEAQFKNWVMSPLTQQEVEFTVKDGSL